MNWNAIAGNCILAAKHVSESSGSKGSFARAKESITKLLEIMQAIENYEKGSQIKYLLSQEISGRLLEAVTGLDDSTNQLIHGYYGEEKSKIFSEIAQLAQKWILQHKSGSKNSLTIKALGKAVQEWNKTSVQLQSVPKVTTNFVSFPEPRSQQGEWYGSLEFAEPDNFYPNTVLSFPLENGRLIRHATSTENAVRILQTLQGSEITINANNDTSRAFCPLVWCGVKLTEAEIDQIPCTPKKHLQGNRYGGVIFEFPISSTRIKDDPRAFVFGTRKYNFEYSQAILIPETVSPEKVFAFQEKVDSNNAPSNLYELELIPNLFEGVWKASYNNKGDWTHPELVFTGDLKVPVSDLKIRFVDHSCIPSTRDQCVDCTGIDPLNSAKKTKAGFENRLGNYVQNLQWDCDCRFYKIMF